MPKVSKDQVLTQDKIRFFYQIGGACPGNEVLYGGVDGQFLNIEDATNPIRSIDTISVQDPKRAGRFRRIGRNRSAPDYPTATVQMLQNRGYYPHQFGEFRTKPVTFYAVAGDTADLSDFLGGWDQYVKIYSYGEATEISEGGGSWDSGEQIQDEPAFTLEAIYSIGALGFATEGAVEVYSEVIDQVYGTLGDGYTAIYAVSNNVVASTGQAPSIVYRTSKNGTWTNTTITGAASTDVPQAIAVLGKYLVVLFNDGATGGYFYAELNQESGVPGSFSKITTGFVTNKPPTDIYAPNSRSAFICGEEGYVYKLGSVSSGVTVLEAGAVTTQNLNRISGTADGTLVCVGESDTIIYSEDRGNSWQTSTAVTGGGNGLDALRVVSAGLWWVGDDSGDVYFTTNKGNTWTEKVINSALTTIQDIVFPTDEVGFMLGTISGPTAQIWTTWDGGESWTKDEPRILSTPTADRFNRISFPEETEHAILANYAVIGGLAGNGSDGIVLEMAPKQL